MGYIVFFAILALGFTFAATVNDIVDIPIDTISNKHRPLVAGTLTIENYKAIAVILGLFIVSGALLLNYNLFIDTIVFHICFYLYSVPPLRLKKHFLSGGILLAWAGLSTVMAGYSLLAVYPQFNSFPLKLTLIIFCFLFIIVHIRDFKDIEGDSHEGIQTLPVVFGEKKARRIIGGAVLIAGILTGTALLSTFLGFALVLYVLSFSFWAILFFQKVDERIAFLFMYATVILAICML